MANTQEKILKIDSFLVNQFGEEISIAEKINFIQSADINCLLEIIQQMDYDGANKRGALSLKSKIKKAIWTVKPAGESAKEKDEAEFIRENFEAIKNGLINALFTGVIYGYNVLYPVYEIKNGKWHFKKIIDLGPRGFKFNSDWKLFNSLTLKIGNKYLIPNRTKPLNEKDFIVYSYDMVESNRYGQSLRLRNYYLWLFYRESLQIRSLYNKKATIPSFIALSSANASNNNKDEALEISSAMRSVKNGTGGVLYNVDSIVKLDANSNGYKSLQEFQVDLKNEMIQNYTGSSLSTETQNAGSSYNIANLHQQTASDFALEIANNFKETINYLFKIIIDLNRIDSDTTGYPVIDIHFKELADIKNIIETGKQGVPLKKDVLINDYKIPIADEEDFENDNVIYLVPEQSEINPESQANKLDISKIMNEFFAESKKKS